MLYTVQEVAKRLKTNVNFVYMLINLGLNVTLLGQNEYHEKNQGVLGTLERVYYVIHNGIGYLLEFLGEDEYDERITYILDRAGGSPEQGAKMLLGEMPVQPD